MHRSIPFTLWVLGGCATGQVAATPTNQHPSAEECTSLKADASVQLTTRDGAEQTYNECAQAKCADTSQVNEGECWGKGEYEGRGVCEAEYKAKNATNSAYNAAALAAGRCT